MVQTTDARKYLDNYERSIQGMNEIFKGVNHPLLRNYQVERRDINGKSALELTMDMSAMFAGMPEIARKQMQSMFGREGKLAIYMAAVDDKAVVMAYENKEQLARAMAAYSDAAVPKLDADPLVAQTSALLLQNPHVVFYWSPQGTLDFLRQVLQGLFAGNAPIAIPEFPA